MEPMPRHTPAPYSPLHWRQGPITPLEPVGNVAVADLNTVLQRRRTRREFEPLSLSLLGQLLGLSCQTHAVRASPFGFDQELRACPSAGALHPIHVLCQREPGGMWERYDPLSHALVGVLDSLDLARAARTCADSIVTSTGATLLALVAEPGRTEAKYAHPESLVWRDAGVVIGYLALVAEALGLSLCPLGTTGNAFVSPLAAGGGLEGVGLLLVGARPRLTLSPDARQERP